jgi:hypothetical protein
VCRYIVKPVGGRPKNQMASTQFSTDIFTARMPRSPEPPWKSARSDSDPSLAPWEQRAWRLNAVLKVRDLSPRELSLRVGGSSAHIAHVLSGRIRSPRSDFWQQIAELTGTTVSYLLEGELPMFRDADPEGVKFPSREGILGSAEHLPADFAHLVKADLLADNAHATDPGPAYWAAQLSALIAKHSPKRLR